MPRAWEAERAIPKDAQTQFGTRGRQNTAPVPKTCQCPFWVQLGYIVPRPNLSRSHAFCTVAGTWNKSSKVGCEFCNKAGLGLPQSINSTISKLGLKAKS